MGIIKEYLKKSPLESRIKVTIQYWFLSEYGGTPFMPLDDNGEEIPEAVEANRICYEKAQPLIDMVMRKIEQWRKDGCP